MHRICNFQGEGAIDMHYTQKLYLFGIASFLLLFITGCGPVYKTVRPDSSEIGNIKKLAIVLPKEGEFAVYNERAKATATPVLLFGAIGAGIASAHNQSLDEKTAQMFEGNLNDLSCRTIFLDSLNKTLKERKKFENIDFFDDVSIANENNKYDGIVTIKILGWGLRLIERSTTELMAPFVDLEIKMEGVNSKVLWDEHNTFVGKEKRTLDTYKESAEVFKNDLQETIQDASQGIAITLIY